MSGSAKRIVAVLLWALIAVVGPAAEAQTDGQQRVVERARLALDAFKVPHHGSRANLSPALLRALECSRHLFSSNGTNTKHPHPEAVARTLEATAPGSTLYFNYSTRFNEAWADDELEEQHEYEALYPDEGAAGLGVTLGED